MHQARGFNQSASARLPVLLLFVALSLTACATTGTPGPGTGSGVIGPITFGQAASGAIAGAQGVAVWHTYILTVPSGTTSITIRMDANADLDMAAKYGSEIISYDPVTGDYDFIDTSLDPFAEFVIGNPQAGEWYIDVFNGLGPGVTGSYTLLVTAP